MSIDAPLGIEPQSDAAASKEHARPRAPPEADTHDGAAGDDEFKKHLSELAVGQRLHALESYVCGKRKEVNLATPRHPQSLE